MRARTQLAGCYKRAMLRPTRGSSHRYANRARNIKNQPVKNVRQEAESQIEALKEQVKVRVGNAAGCWVHAATSA